MRWCQLQANEKVQMKKRREKKLKNYLRDNDSNLEGEIQLLSIFFLLLLFF